MKITSVSTPSSLDKLAEKVLAARRSVTPEYIAWFKKIQEPIKRMIDMTRSMSTGGFMKNRPDMRDNILRYINDLSLLDDPSQTDMFDKIRLNKSDFDKYVNIIYTDWNSSVSKIEKQKAALDNYMNTWNKVKEMIDEGDRILYPYPRTEKSEVREGRPIETPKVEAPKAPKFTLKTPTEIKETPQTSSQSENIQPKEVAPQPGNWFQRWLSPIFRG